MSVVGVSPSEVWKAFIKCKEIYSAFRGVASQQLRDFSEELSRVEAALEFARAEQAQTGRKLPGEAALEKTLNDCYKHLERNKVLLEEHSGPSGAFSKAYRKIKSTFENRIATFQVILARHRHEILDYKVNLLLYETRRIAIQLAGGAVVGPSSPSLERNGHELVEFQEEIAELAGIITSYQQLAREHEAKNTSIQIGNGSIEATANTHPELVRLNAQFWTIIASIFRLTNVAVDYHPPFILSDGLDHHLASFKHQGIFEATGESLKSPRSSMIFPRRTEIKISVQPDPKKSRQPINIVADTYIFVGRRFIFHNKHRRAVFEHRFATDCHPDTHHRQRMRKGRVEFLSDQDISILPVRGQSVENPHKALVKYQIDDEEAYMRFQSDLRGDRLLREFSFTKLRSEHSSDGNDADIEHVKLWQRNRKHTSFILTSPACFKERRVVHEWPLHWLEPVHVQDNPEIVRLVFVHPPPCPWSNLDSKRRSRLLEQRPSISKECTCGSSTSSSSSSSVYSSDSGQDSLPYAQLSWFTKVGYLDFTFEGSERKLFVDQLEAVRNGTSPSLTEPYFSSPSNLNSSISSPNSLQSVPLPSPTTSRHDSVQGPMTSRGTMYSPTLSQKGKHRADPPLGSLPEAAPGSSAGFSDPSMTVSELTRRMDFASVEPNQSIESTEDNAFYITRSDAVNDSTPKQMGTRPGQLLDIDPKWIVVDSDSS